MRTRTRRKSSIWRRRDGGRVREAMRLGGLSHRRAADPRLQPAIRRDAIRSLNDHCECVLGYVSRAGRRLTRRAWPIPAAFSIFSTTWNPVTADTLLSVSIRFPDDFMPPPPYVSRLISVIRYDSPFRRSRHSLDRVPDFWPGVSSSERLVRSDGLYSCRCRAIHRNSPLVRSAAVEEREKGLLVLPL